LRIVGPNFRVVLRLRGGVVAEAARPVSYMKGWEVARVTALAERWGWKIEDSDVEQWQAPASQPRALGASRERLVRGKRSPSRGTSFGRLLPAWSPARAAMARGT